MGSEAVAGFHEAEKYTYLICFLWSLIGATALLPRNSAFGDRGGPGAVDLTLLLTAFAGPGLASRRASRRNKVANGRTTGRPHEAGVADGNKRASMRDDEYEEVGHPPDTALAIRPALAAPIHWPLLIAYGLPRFHTPAAAAHRKEQRTGASRYRGGISPTWRPLAADSRNPTRSAFLIDPGAEGLRQKRARPSAGPSSMAEAVAVTWTV